MEYHFSDKLAMRTRFCGYVVNRDEPGPSAEPAFCSPAPANGTGPSVLATAGGGEDGFFLLQTFLRAAVGAPWKGIAVAGPMSPALKTLERMAARAKVSLHTFVPNLSCLFRSVDALVCMGGYNTLVEAVSTGVPTVCVPRTFPRREQLIRARAFERLGLISVIEPEKLTTENLERAIQSLIGASHPARVGRVGSALDFGGARRAAKQLLALSAASVSGRRTRPAEDYVP